MHKILFLFLLCVCTLCTPVIAKNILSQKDVKIYQDIFKLQRQGHYEKAQKLTSTLSNKLLMGYVLHDRYFSNKYKTTQPQIEHWLTYYDYLPIATDIYALGMQKKMKLKAKKPVDLLYGGSSNSCSSMPPREGFAIFEYGHFYHLPKAKQKQAKLAIQKIKSVVRSGTASELENTLKQIKKENIFSKNDMLSAKILLAQLYFFEGNDDKVFDTISPVLYTSINQVPLANFIAGLSAWRQKYYDQAAIYFKVGALHKKADSFLRSAAAFWGARASLKIGNYIDYYDLLLKSAESPPSFYGMIALRLLGQDEHPVWENKKNIPHKKKHVEFNSPSINRFYALKQVGKNDMAKEQLVHLYVQANSATKKKIIQLAYNNNFANDLIAYSGTFTGKKERFPAPDWVPYKGWKIDKALVYAFVRQESCFNKRALSYMGAKGLMQLMPDTAKFVAKLMGINYVPYQLHNESYNLSLGQYYIQHLMGLKQVNNNLIFMATAYNAGPGNLNKWKRNLTYQNDPLLFIESIPSLETRSFVERILFNYWMYSALLDKPTPSLNEIAENKWPLYH